MSGPSIVEAAPVWSLLYLNNNLHVAHHTRPSLAWYRLPAYYRAERAALIARNRGYVIHGYGEIFRRYLVRSKEPVAYPEPAWLERALNGDAAPGVAAKLVSGPVERTGDPSMPARQRHVDRTASWQRAVHYAFKHRLGVPAGGRDVRDLRAGAADRSSACCRIRCWV